MPKIRFRLVRSRALLCCAVSLVLLFVTAARASAQDNFFGKWQRRASATQALQPKWAPPVVAPYPMLIQVFRSDFTRQISPTHVQTWNFGASRGLNLIPFARTEVDLFVPPFFEHADRTRDGFGDLSMSAKYRLASGNERHGDYLVSALLIAAVPTGSYKNGQTDASLTPTLSMGKGWKQFDVMTNVGGGLPTGSTRTIGRTVLTNTVAQAHTGKYLWPELEINTTAWYGGTRDGKVQTFLTPGILAGKFAIHPKAEHGRAGLAAGFGFQTAVTQYHTYNHALVFSGRLLF